MNIMSNIIELETSLGLIKLRLRPDKAPKTCEYISKLVRDGLYDGCCFYRSDFVIQMGLTQKSDGTKRHNPHGNLTVNESQQALHLADIGGVSNTRGACAIAHFECQNRGHCDGGCVDASRHAKDCGNSEFFINLQPNAHLDTVWGGYCVFAEVVIDEDNSTPDNSSMSVVDRIAAHIKNTRENVETVKATLV